MVKIQISKRFFCGLWESHRGIKSLKDLVKELTNIMGIDLHVEEIQDFIEKCSYLFEQIEIEWMRKKPRTIYGQKPGLAGQAHNSY